MTKAKKPGPSSSWEERVTVALRTYEDLTILRRSIAQGEKFTTDLGLGPDTRAGRKLQIYLDRKRETLLISMIELIKRVNEERDTWTKPQEQ